MSTARCTGDRRACRASRARCLTSRSRHARLGRRQQHAVGRIRRVLHAVVRAVHADQHLDLVVVRREILVVHGPVEAEAVARVRLEVVRPIAQRDAAPVIGAAAQHARAPPLELARRIVGGAGVGLAGHLPAAVDGRVPEAEGLLGRAGAAQRRLAVGLHHRRLGGGLVAPARPRASARARLPWSACRPSGRPPAPEPTTITSYVFLSAAALVMNDILGRIVGAVPRRVIAASYVGVRYAAAQSILRPVHPASASHERAIFTGRQIPAGRGGRGPAVRALSAAPAARRRNAIRWSSAACRSPAISRCRSPAWPRTPPSRPAPRPTTSLRVQQVQRLAGDQGIADGRAHPGRLHAGAAGHGPRRQEDPGEDRVAGPSLGRRDHGAHGFALPALRASSRASASRSRAASRSTSCSCARCWRART